MARKKPPPRFPEAKPAKTAKKGSAVAVFVLIGLVVVGAGVINVLFQPSAPPSQLSVPAGPPANAITVADWGVPDGTTLVATNEDEITADNLMLVFDLSGSMSERACEGGGTKAEVARRSIAAFLPTVPPATRLGLIVFDNGAAREVVPLGLNNREEIAKTAAEARLGGGTPLGASLTLAYQALAERAKAQQGSGSYRVMILTDGEASDRALMEANIQSILGKTPIEVHTAGFCIGAGHALNRSGETYYASANTPAAILEAFSAALAETDSWRRGN